MSWQLIVTLCAIAVIIVIIFFALRPGLWFRALISGTYVPMASILGMRIKHLDVQSIVMAYIKARKSGVIVTVDQLENHVQALGNIENVISACIVAVNAGVSLSVETAMAVDLSGRDINLAVRDNITPRVIETQPVTTVCKNGVELTARAKITLRTNLEKLIGGALEETIIARVCEGIVTCIGNAVNHTDLLENPDRISKQLLVNKNIASDSAFDIISIDVSKILVGRNVGAELEIDEAESRKIIAQADAEQRRTQALASEQEMRAITQEMRAKVVAAEALLPQALADALDRGTLSVGDFYRLQNLVSDTDMRKKIAGRSDQDMLPSPKKKSKLA
jgi:uncharacterized protein YqfA (UPF0365 family)